MAKSTFVKLERGDKNTCCGTCYLTKRQKCLCCTLLWLPMSALALFIAGLMINAALIADPFERIVLDPDPILIAASENEINRRAETLGKAIRFRTISFSPGEQNYTELSKLNEFITLSFPNIHSASFISKYQVNQYSILFRIEGTENTKNPYMLCAHLDVVPEGFLGSWEYDPFLGDIIEESGKEYIFGRGAIDDKHSVFGILEALEHLVKAGERPKRTFYVALGHDEEVSGFNGAGHIKLEMEKILINNEEELDFILDEGPMVLKNLFPGTDLPMIAIGVTEKGWAIFDLEVETEQFHSSMPPKESAIGILSKALSSLEENRQPSKFGEGPEYETVNYLSAHVQFGYKIVLGNLWLFSGMISKLLSWQVSTDALQRTTTAITSVKSGFKDNVVPAVAKAVVNHRVHPSDTIDAVVASDTKNIADDRVKIIKRAYTPSPKVSPYKGRAMGFQVIANSALEVFPSAKIVPTVMVGNTDTIQYVNLTTKIYRFSPAFMLPKDLERFHGFNERISVKNYNEVQ